MAPLAHLEAQVVCQFHTVAKVAVMTSDLLLDSKAVAVLQRPEDLHSCHVLSPASALIAQRTGSYLR